ncbi:MAG: HEPN domain-containing protein [Bacteroidales bacterium]
MENNKINIEKVYNYWIESSERDFQTMQHLFESKDYHWALFIGHLVIEKLLKAKIVMETKNHAPLSHDLRRLAKSSGLNLNNKYTDWLDTITTFNINARYDSYKQDFYNRCTHDFTAKWINNIKYLREWIKEKL